MKGIALLRCSSQHVLQASTSEEHLDLLGEDASLGRLGQADRSRLILWLVAILGTKEQDVLDF